MGDLSATNTETKDKPYSFTFNKAKDTWVCSVHGEVHDTGWVACWNGCEDGYFDAYEDDPINNDPGVMLRCSECCGHGGWTVCGECCKNSPDVEW